MANLSRSRKRALLLCAVTATVHIHFNESEPLSVRFGGFLNGISVCSAWMSLFQPPPPPPTPHTPLTPPSPPTPPFRVRKRPWSGLREEKVPYLIISSHDEKHTAWSFYMATAAGVGFPLARVRLVRGLIVTVFGLNELTRWRATSALRISDTWAFLVGIYQDKSHKLWSQAERTDSQNMCVCVSVSVCVFVCVRQRHLAYSKPHFLISFFFLWARPPVCGLLYNNWEGRALTHTAACSIIPMITCGFAHSAPHRNRSTLSARCAFSPQSLSLLDVHSLTGYLGEWSVMPL